MTAPTRDRRLTWFFAGFLLVALLVAGGLSYLASSAPDGLDSVTLHGCQVTQVDGHEQLDGTCIAQHATDSATAGSPLADYAVGGAAGSNGVAGVIGVLVCAAVAAGLFRLLRRRVP
ncbi:PDGLE domain-containing protein [Pseudonocardia sp. CA-107938]|uniref:PDGLE domain-containing protein n=1 Tax=Pseudonocardia sp. CA-107938 TaxID=3240021 RepID=UPI003D8D856E